MNSASGMEAPIVKVPQALSCRRDDDDEEDGDRGRPACNRADLAARDIRQRSAAAPCGGPENDEVVDRTGKADPRDQPDEAGRVAELRGQYWPDERARAGDGREMMAEKDEPVRWMVVVAVVPHVGRGQPRVVQGHHAGGDERAVVAIRDHQNADDREDDVEGPHEPEFSSLTRYIRCSGQGS